MRYRKPICMTCGKYFDETMFDVNCPPCNERILAEKIKNRQTELQRWYDISCEREIEIIAEIENENQKIEALKLELKKCRRMIDRCIESESRYGVKIL